MADYKTLMAKSRELHAAGNIEDARRVAEIALKTRQSTKPQTFLERLGYGDDVWDRRRDNILGDDDPTTQNTGEKIGTFLNKAGESMTMGLVGDETSAAVESVVPGVNYADRRDHYRAQERQFDQENPVASLTADVGGAMVLPGVGLTKAGGTLAKRAAISSGATAGMSGVHGFAEGEGGVAPRAAGALPDAGVGAIVGGAIPFAGAGVQKISEAVGTNRAIKRAAQNAPTTDQLREQGRAAYQAVDDAGVSVNPNKVRQGLGDIVDGLRQEGAHFTGAEKVLPASRGIMEAAGDVGQGANSVPFQELDIFRRYIGNAAASNLESGADTRAATGALTALDDFIQGLKSSDIDGGDLEALQTMLPKARNVWARMSRSQTIDDAIEAAGNYQSGSASGIRNQFRRILNNKKLNRGFSEAEKGAMRKVVNGGVGDALLHYAGSGLGMLGTVGGGAAAGAATGVGGLPGMLLGAGAAAGARKLSERSANKNAELVRSLIANGGMKALPPASQNARSITERLLRRATSGSTQ